MATKLDSLDYKILKMLSLNARSLIWKLHAPATCRVQLFTNASRNFTTWTSSRAPSR